MWLDPSLQRDGNTQILVRGPPWNCYPGHLVVCRICMSWNITAHNLDSPNFQRKNKVK